MRLGRDYTNCLVLDHLSEQEKREFEQDKIDLATVNAIGLTKAKLDVEKQFEVTRELGMNHVELDGDPPNPYLELSPARRREIQEAAESQGVTLSFHLPYSYVGGSICCPQNQDRKIALNLQERCISFAEDVGAKYVNIHPGSVPFYHRLGRYNGIIRAALFTSLLKLDGVARDHGLALHLENNTAFDGVFSEPEDCLSLVKELRSAGAEICFNFDIGHWFTKADTGGQIPNSPELVMEKIPPEYFGELHLNDYVPGKKMFHPPIHLAWGLLKRENLERYAKIVKKKGVKVVILETAMKDKAQVLGWRDVLKQETDYVKNIFGA